MNYLALRLFGKGTRETRMKKIYCCTPEWQKTAEADPFDYQLRKPAEIARQHELYPPKFRIQAEYKAYFLDDTRWTKNNLDIRSSVCKLVVDMRELRLSPLQRQRFIYLLGPRYNPSYPFKAKIVVRQYPKYEQNYERGLDIIKQMYWESLRAPTTQTTFRRNPYLREKTLKRLYGKIREERKANMAAEREQIRKYEEERGLEIAEAEILGQEKAKEAKERRIEMAKAREKLGIRDEEVLEDGSVISATEGDGVDDKVFELLTDNEARYKTQVSDKKARPEVKIVTEVRGISKEEINEAIAREEKFTEH